MILRDGTTNAGRTHWRRRRAHWARKTGKRVGSSRFLSRSIRRRAHTPIRGRHGARLTPEPEQEKGLREVIDNVRADLWCHSAWGPNADRRGNSLNCLRKEGSNSEADSQTTMTMSVSLAPSTTLTLPTRRRGTGGCYRSSARVPALRRSEVRIPSAPPTVVEFYLIFQ